jgi:hypothetical protein
MLALEGTQIRGTELSDAERAIFSIIPDFNVEMRFTEADRRLIREFMERPPR